MMKKAFDTQTALLRREFDDALSSRDEKIKKLERLLNNYETRVDWKLKDFDVALKKKMYLQSPKFEFSETKWFIGLFTNGDTQDSNGFVSMYLFYDPPPRRNRTITLEFTLTVVNRRDPNDSIKKGFKTTFPVDGGQGWGDRKFMSCQRITEAEGFLKESTLDISAHIHAKKVTWLL